jgi:hypothetical protein
MATVKQEQLYNEIIEYYGYADRLIRAVEDSTHKLSEQQFDIIEEVTNRLEDCADKLATHYIEFVKRGWSEPDAEIIRSTMNDLAATIEQCRNKILMLNQNRSS